MAKFAIQRKCGADVNSVALQIVTYMVLLCRQGLSQQGLKKATHFSSTNGKWKRTGDIFKGSPSISFVSAAKCSGNKGRLEQFRIMQVPRTASQRRARKRMWFAAVCLRSSFFRVLWTLHPAWSEMTSKCA